MLGLAIFWCVVHGESTYMGPPACAGTRGHGRRVENQHDIAHSPGFPGCKASQKCRKEQRSQSNAGFVMLY